MKMIFLLTITTMVPVASTTSSTSTLRMHEPTAPKRIAIANGTAEDNKPNSMALYYSYLVPQPPR